MLMITKMSEYSIICIDIIILRFWVHAQISDIICNIKIKIIFSEHIKSVWSLCIAFHYHIILLEVVVNMAGAAAVQNS